MTLDQTPPGRRVKILSLSHVGAMRRRLQEIGLTKGTLVECVGKSPGGDPSAYLIRGAVIAIRASDSRGVEVEEVEAWD
ncbi:MAG: ferrous iron transport protein A [Ruminococcaceae bacterium]|nr:ferrous iron transport protein A [Oscillospiraceae bacterium]